MKYISSDDLFWSRFSQHCQAKVGLVRGRTCTVHGKKDVKGEFSLRKTHHRLNSLSVLIKGPVLCTLKKGAQ